MKTPDRPFDEPWQAQAFAMTVHLHEQGHFTWAEWAEALSAQIHSGADRAYYGHWLCALEALIAAKGIASQSTLADTAEAWIDAAARTPHGTPIALSPHDDAADPAARPATPVIALRTAKK